MKKNWFYTNNTFAAQTLGSHRKALILFEDSYSKLRAAGVNDGDISAIAQDFEPHYRAYRELTANKYAAGSLYEGYTSAFEAVLGELPLELRKWEAQVYIQYLEDSPQERMIFANKRKPFMSGSYESRINTIKGLINVLQRFPTLQGLQTQIQLFHDRLEQARWQQQEYEGENDALSTRLEQLRIVTCEELYGVLARLMYKFRHETDRIADFFDLSLLRTATSTGELSYLRGTVKDAQGNKVEGALVRVKDEGIEITTDANGEFYVEVEAGQSDIEVSVGGYQLWTQAGVTFVKNEITELSVMLSTLMA